MVIIVLSFPDLTFCLMVFVFICLLTSVGAGSYAVNRHTICSDGPCFQREWRRRNKQEVGCGNTRRDRFIASVVPMHQIGYHTSPVPEGNEHHWRTGADAMNRSLRSFSVFRANCDKIHVTAYEQGVMNHAPTRCRCPRLAGGRRASSI